MKPEEAGLLKKALFGKWNLGRTRGVIVSLDDLAQRFVDSGIAANVNDAKGMIFVLPLDTPVYYNDDHYIRFKKTDKGIKEYNIQLGRR